MRRSLTTTYNALSFVFDAPSERWAENSFVYSTGIDDAKAGNAHPVHLELNGETVWSSDGVAKGDEIVVRIEAGTTLPGLNELKWVYDTAVANNWLTFTGQNLKFRPPSNGLVIILR